MWTKNDVVWLTFFLRRICNFCENRRKCNLSNLSFMLWKTWKPFQTDHYYSNQQKVWGWWFCSHIILINITPRTSYWVCKLMDRQKLEVRLQKTKLRLLKICLWMQKGVVVFVGIFVRICNKYLPLTFESMLCKCQRLKWPIK